MNALTNSGWRRRPAARRSMARPAPVPSVPARRRNRQGAPHVSSAGTTMAKTENCSASTNS